jgi:pimeloyl-ACP methyl ester carboxylesterase
MQKQLKRNPAALLKSFYRAVVAPERHKIALQDTLNIPQLHIGLELLKICDIRKDLESINVPVTILHGEKDLIASAKLAEYLHSNIQNSSLKLYPDEGHALFFRDLG